MLIYADIEKLLMMVCILTYSAFTTGFKLSNKMDDFSNHLSAKDASRNSKNAAWGGTFAKPKNRQPVHVLNFFFTFYLDVLELSKTVQNVNTANLDAQTSLDEFERLTRYD